MFKTLANAWKIPELRKKLIFTLLMLMVYRIGNVIPVPFIDAHVLADFFDRTLSDTSSLQDILNNYLVRFGYHRFSDRVTSRAYHDTDGFIGTLALNMQSEYREKRAGYAEILRNSLISMLVYLVRNDTESGAVESITGYLKDYAEKHYVEPIALTALAEELHYSLTHVSLTFKRDMQMSFREYVQRLRMEQACRLLRVTEKSVAEIAALVGYTDPAFFYKTFRKALGVTPKTYRKQNQNIKNELIV